MLDFWTVFWVGLITGTLGTLIGNILSYITYDTVSKLLRRHRLRGHRKMRRVATA